MATIITKETLLPLGLIAGLLSVAAFVGAQNQKLDQVAADAAAMKPAIIQAQVDIAIIKEKLSPQRGISAEASTPRP